MNDKCRSLIFRNSNILRQKKISLRNILPITSYNIKYKFYESLINKNNYIYIIKIILLIVL